MLKLIEKKYATIFCLSGLYQGLICDNSHQFVFVKRVLLQTVKTQMKRQHNTAFM